MGREGSFLILGVVVLFYFSGVPLELLCKFLCQIHANGRHLITGNDGASSLWTFEVPVVDRLLGRNASG